MKFIESRNPLHSYSDEKFIFRRQIYFSKEKRKIEKTTKRIEQNKGSKGPIKARRYVFTIFSSKSRTSYIFFFFLSRPGQRRPPQTISTFHRKSSREGSPFFPPPRSPLPLPSPVPRNLAEKRAWTTHEGPPLSDLRSDQASSIKARPT